MKIYTDVIKVNVTIVPSWLNSLFGAKPTCNIVEIARCVIVRDETTLSAELTKELHSYLDNQFGCGRYIIESIKIIDGGEIIDT